MNGLFFFIVFPVSTEKNCNNFKQLPLNSPRTSFNIKFTKKSAAKLFQVIVNFYIMESEKNPTESGHL